MTSRVNNLPTRINGLLEYVKVTEGGGTKEYRNKEGELHRLDGPSVEGSKGTRIWFINGSCHRDNDDPAVEWADGSKWWFYHNVNHRLSGPAIDNSNGHKEWHVNGELHRINDPAVIFYNGAEWWYRHGILHRVDGPAIIRRQGQEDWYVNGKPIDIKPILERFDISPDWKSWADAEKMIVRLALP